MRSCRTLAVLAAAVLGVGSAVQAADRSGMYLGLTGGYTQPSGDFEFTDVEIEDEDLPDSSFDIDNGWAGLFAVGWNVNRNFRMEGEFGYRNNDLETTTIDSPIYTVNIDYDGMYSAMFNAYFDIPLGETFALYVGGGIGLGFFPIDVEYESPVAPDASAEGALGALCYQGMAGVTVNIAPKVHLSAGYRIFSGFESSIETDDFEGSWEIPVWHAGEVSLRFDL